MAVKNVLLLGEEKLRQKSGPVSNISSDETLRIMEDLRDTLTHLQDLYGMGRALAAPQIGYPKQIIFFDFDGNSFYMVNPQIVSTSEKKFEVWDSCFSFELAFFVKIPRRKAVVVKYLNGKGTIQRRQVKGDKSELFQHEIDHLDGKLAVDHLESPENIIMRQEWEEM